jgi:DNA polymerase (family 10)
MLALDTDAHEQSQVGNLMRYAVGNARRGWAARGHVVNARSYDELRAWLDHR